MASFRRVAQHPSYWIFDFWTVIKKTCLFFMFRSILFCLMQLRAAVFLSVSLADNAEGCEKKGERELFLHEQWFFTVRPFRLFFCTDVSSWRIFQKDVSWSVWFLMVSGKTLPSLEAGTDHVVPHCRCNICIPCSRLRTWNSLWKFI